jgi:mono/diheme cytochrome c family protein
MKLSILATVAPLAFGLAFEGFAADGKAGSGALPPASSRKDVAFAKDVLPILQKSCVGCHGPEKSKGRIRLDSLEGALKGGEHGKIVLIGDSARSKIVQAVAGQTDELMPPKGKGDPLTPEQIGLIRAWIDQGAK